jgi:hypothetical protein
MNVLRRNDRSLRYAALTSTIASAILSRAFPFLEGRNSRFMMYGLVIQFSSPCAIIARPDCA